MASSTPAHPAAALRRANLSRMLTLLHGRGALTRAELTSATGLNRSTVGDLVDALRTAGLVVGAPGASAGRSGRPSPVVAIDPEVTAVAVNPEVDAVTLGLVGLDRVVRRRERIPHRARITPAATAELVAARLRAWTPARPPVAVGLAVPGLVDAADGSVRSASHLGWQDAPLADLVRTATGLPAVVGNDATLGLAAEHRFGAARGALDAVHLNGGASGIGGAVLAGGVMLGGANGYAGEFGRMALTPDPAAPLLEDEVSRGRLLHALGAADLDEEGLAAALSAESTGAVAAETTRQRRLLAGSVANAVTLLNPAVVVLGGFLATLVDLDADGFAAMVHGAAMAGPAEAVTVRSASLGADRLLLGAADAAFGALLADPVGVGGR